MVGMSQPQPPAFPTTEQAIHAASSEIIALRRQGATWRVVSERTGFTRMDAIRLGHGVFELIDALAAVRKAELLNA
jgi:hypothetical protein